MREKFLFIILFLTVAFSCSQEEPQQYQGYVEGENIYLASPYAGILEKLVVQRGETVRQGQLLFSLDPNPQFLLLQQDEATLLEAQKVLKDLIQPRRSSEISAIRAQIEQVDAQVKLASIRVDRMRELFTRQAVSKDTLDAALAFFQEQKKIKEQYQSNLELAQLGSRVEQIKAQQARVEAFRAKLSERRWQLNQKTIRAPAAGIIFDTYYKSGEFVANQQAVLSLLTPDNVRLEFFVPAKVLANLNIGQNIAFNCEGCLQNSKATISYISPEAEYLPPLVYSRENSEKLVFRIQARLSEPEKFKPGQPLTVLLP